MKIKEYEIVDEIENDDEYDYEEMSFGELLNKAGLSEDERSEAIRQRFAVNIHIMVSDESKEMVMETLNDRLTDERLAKMNAIVLLSLKKKGRGEAYESLSQSEFKKIVDFALENKISIGFDSCSCPKFLESVKGNKDYERFEKVSEPCEALLFSWYCSADGKFTPCSFCENKLDNFQEGIDVVNCDDFLQDIWNCEQAVSWRKNLLNKRNAGDFTCPVYEV